MSSAKKAAFIGVLAVFALTWLKPLWPAEQALHSSLTVVGLIWLIVHDRRWSMRTFDFAAICVFISLSKSSVSHNTLKMLTLPDPTQFLGACRRWPSSLMLSRRPLIRSAMSPPTAALCFLPTTRL